jgi:hypothetical protein
MKDQYYCFILKPKLYYEYNTSSSNEQVLLRPVLNIIEKGIVPREISSKNKIDLNNKKLWCCFIIAFSIFFPCLLSNRVNCSVLFRFYNSTTNHTSMFVNLKFLKYCREETLNTSLLTQFYNTNQMNEYLLMKERKFIKLKLNLSKVRYSYSARYRDFASTTLATILAYSLVIAVVVFLLVFCTAMILFCLYRMTTKKKKISEK